MRIAQLHINIKFANYTIPADNFKGVSEIEQSETVSEGSEDDSIDKSEESSEADRNFSVAKAALERMNARKLLLSEDKKFSTASKKCSTIAKIAHLPYTFMEIVEECSEQPSAKPIKRVNFDLSPKIIDQIEPVSSYGFFHKQASEEIESLESEPGCVLLPFKQESYPHIPSLMFEALEEFVEKKISELSFGDKLRVQSVSKELKAGFSFF